MRIGAGAVLVRGKEILLAKRAEDREFYPGVWDVIGGHCQEGETPTAALLRELHEEIGVRAQAFEEIAVLDEPDPATHGDGQYHIFVITAWEGEPSLRNAEHCELRWLGLDEAQDLPLPHPSYCRILSVALQRSS